MLFIDTIRADAYIQIIEQGGMTMNQSNPYGAHLPIFPTLYGCITEERIETAVEKLTDRADGALMSGKATQAQYDAWSAALQAWSDRQFASRHV